MTGRLFPVDGLLGCGFKVEEVNDKEVHVTYQDLTGSHGTVLYQGTGPDGEKEARRILAEFLHCESIERGYYCYTHNPYSRKV